MTPVRCIDCKHFTGRAKRCAMAPRRTPVYQSAAWRTCTAYREPGSDERLICTDELPAPPAPPPWKRTGLELLPDWSPARDAVSAIWMVAHLETYNTVTQYRMVFPKPVDWRVALEEARRHWREFLIKAA